MAGVHFQHRQGSRVHTEFAEAGATEGHREVVYVLRAARKFNFSGPPWLTVSVRLRVEP